MPDNTPDIEDDKRSPITNRDVLRSGRREEDVRSLAAIEAEVQQLDDIATSDSRDVSPHSPVPISPAVFQPGVVAIPKKSKKGVIIGSIVIMLLLAIGGGGLVTYAWYQNPEKVVMDGLIKAMQAKTFTANSTAKISFGDGSMTATFAAQGGSKEGYGGTMKLTYQPTKGPQVTVNGAGMYASNGDLYFRATNVKKAYETTVDTYMDSRTKEAATAGLRMTDAEKHTVKQQVSQLFLPLVNMLEGQWIKVTATDMKRVNERSGQQYECLQAVVQKSLNGKKFSQQLRDLYAKHRALIIRESGNNKGDSKGYVITVDRSKLEAFKDNAKQLSFYNELERCDKKTPGEVNAIDNTADSEVVTNIELWVDQWTHTITDFTVKISDSSTKAVISGTTEFNKPVVVTVPSEFKNLKELQTEIEKTFSSLWVFLARAT